MFPEVPSINNQLAPIKVVDDHEISMAKAQVYRSAKCAMELHKLLKYVDNLEGWMQAKITMAADYLECVCSNLEYDIVSANMEQEPPQQAAMSPEIIAVDEAEQVNPEDRGFMDSQVQIQNGKAVNPYKPGSPEAAKWQAGQRKAQTAPNKNMEEGIGDMFRGKPQDPKQIKADLRLAWLKSLMAAPSNLPRSEAGIIADQMAELGYKPNK